jgi:protein O-mannosyl-transferase
MFEYLKPLKIQIALVAVLCFVLNSNTLNNEYALDDGIIIHQNLNVQAGVKGIGKIMTTDAFQGYLDMVNSQSPLSGGRYRPLSIVTFAIEQSIFGETYGLEYWEHQRKLADLESNNGSEKDIKTEINILQEIKTKMDKSTLAIAPFRHYFQLFYFFLSMIVLLYFLRKHIFSQNSLLAFLTVLLFITHPVHTEVIANIKSRDEILSFLFVILTLHLSFNYINNKTQRNLILLIVSFILALLSKEYAMILPILIVIGWYTIALKEKKEIMNSGLFFLVSVAILFMYIRFTYFSNANTTNKITDVLNDPYLYATPIERLASKVAIVLEYLRVLFFPKDLSSDYSYSHFAYIKFSNWKFIVSLLIYIGMGFGFLYTLKKRLKIAFPIAVFLGFFFLVNNLLFNIGATMGERLVYHSSFGLCLLLVMFGDSIYQKITSSIMLKNVALLVLVLPVLVLFSFKTIDRNKDWKSVKTVPNSALANSNAGTNIYNNEFKKYYDKKNHTDAETKEFENQLKIAIQYFDKAISIHENYVVAHMNRGLCYYYLKDKKNAGIDWSRAAELFNGPNNFLKQNSYIFLQDGIFFGSKKMYKEALESLVIASKMNPTEATIFQNLGGSYYMTGQFKLSADAFSRALTINPTLTEAQNGKRAAEGIYGLEQKVALNPNDEIAKQELNNAYRSCGVSLEYLHLK